MLIPQRYGAKCIQIQIPLGRATEPIVDAVDSIGGIARNFVKEVVFGVGVVALVALVGVVVVVVVVVVSLVGNVDLVEFGEVGFKVEFSVHR